MKSLFVGTLLGVLLFVPMGLSRPDPHQGEWAQYVQSAGQVQVQQSLVGSAADIPQPEVIIDCSQDCLLGFAPTAGLQGSMSAQRSSSDKSRITVSVEIHNPNSESVTLSNVTVVLTANTLSYLSGTTSGFPEPSVSGGQLSYSVSSYSVAASSTLRFSFAIKDQMTEVGGVIWMSGTTQDGVNISTPSITISPVPSTKPPPTTKTSTSTAVPASSSVPTTQTPTSATPTQKPPTNSSTNSSTSTSPSAPVTSAPASTQVAHTTAPASPTNSESQGEPTRSPNSGQRDEPSFTPAPHPDDTDDLGTFLASPNGAATLGGVMMVVTVGGAVVIRRTGLS